MVKRHWTGCILLMTALSFSAVVLAEQAGSIRGMVHDSDFDAPLAAAQVMIAETAETVTTTDEGNYVFGQVEPGNYTLVFSKDGYTRQVKADVVVSPGQMTEIDTTLGGEFEEMEEFIVQDVQIGTGTEAALLDLRMESPALMDSISADLMSQAGASDAASALNLVAGATVQDGKYATVRGLPDRYVNSQMNSVRLPSADADKRAVQLDQFPAAVIESIQVSKTFTPDQQGDASGGAVNVVLKGIPEERVFKINTQTGYNSNVKDAGSDFLTYKGGGVSTWGKDDGRRDIQFDKIGQAWDGAVGVSTDDPKTDYKWSLSLGDKWDFEDFRIGAFGNIFYERESSYYDNGINDRFWVDSADQAAGPPFRMSPVYSGNGPYGDIEEGFSTSLYDITKGSQQVRWGGLGVLGFETENHSLNLLYMYTRSAEDEAVLAKNTRGRTSLHTWWPDVYPELFDDLPFTEPIPDGYNQGSSTPTRNETLKYTERTTQTLQLSGRHTLPAPEIRFSTYFSTLSPELDWTIATSSARLYEPDKREFSTAWSPTGGGQGVHGPYTAGGFFLGNLQRIWKDIQEDSDQYFVNFKVPFEQWTGDEGYMKFGYFNDKVERQYRQDTFSNLADLGAFYFAPWDDYWSKYWPDDENREIDEAGVDVDYTANQKIRAWYYMADVPLNSWFNVIGGYRFEKTELNISVFPDLLPSGQSEVRWYPDDTGIPWELRPGDADVAFSQRDVLPSIGFEFRPWEPVTLRGSYSETVARQTFKELTPIEQREYAGGDTFIGNPELGMSALKNYDLRLDYTPYEGALISVSYFTKDVVDPIEYVQRQGANFVFTKPVNFPEGTLSGYELEFRQKLGHYWEDLEGLSVGANATFINSEVTLPDTEVEMLEFLKAPETTRHMTNAPEHLYNFYTTYDLDKTGTKLALFYTVRGDTLITGAGWEDSKYVPSVYETEYGTLNFSLSQKLGEIWTLKFQAKNLLDPAIETVYRSKYIGDDVTKTSYTKGRDFSISLSASF